MTNFSGKAHFFGLRALQVLPHFRADNRVHLSWKCSSLLARSIIGGAFILISTGIVTAEERKPKTLIELFTSQGCNSCPPANALLKKYIERDDVIALSLPVDYWDYLGWSDTFGKSQFSDRQRRYAAKRGDGKVYTPQIVANGIAHAVGSRVSAVNGAIRKSHASISRHQIPLNVKLEGNKLTIYSAAQKPASTEQSNSPSTPTTVWLALTKKKVNIPVPRGENRGKTITYYNVVHDLKPIGKWNGKSLSITMPKDHSMNWKSDGCIVFLQEGKAGPIIGAAEL